jgi:hypothetical protein
MAQFTGFKRYLVALVKTDKTSTRTWVKRAGRAGWLQEDVAQGGRGVDEEEPFWVGAGAIPVPCLAGPGCQHAGPPCDQARARAPPYLPFPPIVELFLLPLPHRPRFFYFTSTSPSCVQSSTTTTRGHNSSHLHENYRIYTHFFYAGSQPRPSEDHQPCMLTARATSSLRGGHQTLTLSTPICHGSRRAATTRFLGHHNAS